MLGAALLIRQGAGAAIGADCKSVGICLPWFESRSCHQSLYKPANSYLLRLFVVLIHYHPLGIGCCYRWQLLAMAAAITFSFFPIDLPKKRGTLPLTSNRISFQFDVKAPLHSRTPRRLLQMHGALFFTLHPLQLGVYSHHRCEGYVIFSLPRRLT